MWQSGAPHLGPSSRLQQERQQEEEQEQQQEEEQEQEVGASSAHGQLEGMAGASAVHALGLCLGGPPCRRIGCPIPAAPRLGAPRCCRTYFCWHTQHSGPSSKKRLLTQTHLLPHPTPLQGPTQLPKPNPRFATICTPAHPPHPLAPLPGPAQLPSPTKAPTPARDDLHAGCLVHRCRQQQRALVVAVYRNEQRELASIRRVRCPVPAAKGTSSQRRCRAGTGAWTSAQQLQPAALHTHAIQGKRCCCARWCPACVPVPHACTACLCDHGMLLLLCCTALHCTLPRRTVLTAHCGRRHSLQPCPAGCLPAHTFLPFPHVLHTPAPLTHANAHTHTARPCQHTPTPHASPPMPARTHRHARAPATRPCQPTHTHTLAPPAPPPAHASTPPPLTHFMSTIIVFAR